VKIPTLEEISSKGKELGILVRHGGRTAFFRLAVHSSMSYHRVIRGLQA
jgi:hypothetical protein